MTGPARGVASRGAAVLLGVLLAIGLAELGLRVAGEEIAIDPGAFVASPAPGAEYTLRPLWHGSTYGAPVRVNSLGFRGPEPQVGTPDRIVFLGDSFTFGFGVREEDTYPARFARSRGGGRGGVEIVNLALPGYNSTQAVAALEAHVETLHPRCVIYGVTPNDELPPQFVNRGGRLAPTISLAPWMPLQIRRVLVRSRLVQFVLRRVNALQARRNAAGPARDPFPSTLPRTREALARLAGLSRAHAFHAYVLILPFLEGSPDRYPFQPTHRAIARAAQDAGLPTADALEALREAARRGTRPESLWVDSFDHHPNAAGHLLFARFLDRTGWCR